MIRPAILSAASAIALGACAANAAPARPAAAFVAARLLADEVAPMPAPARPAIAAEPKRRGAPAPESNGVGASRRAAVQEPDPGAYVGAVQVYPWSEGALYRLYAAPERVGDIVLQSGERLVSVAAGDTARWVIGDTTSGNGPTRRTHVLVKPTALGLRTNLLIATDRRVYHVELESGGKAVMAGIAWTYPDDSLVALHKASQADSAVASGVTLDALDFNYRIEGDRPPWRPLRAFDDGHQVFIEFPPALLEGEAPPLFVTGRGGRAELVNYRQRGRYYIVDRLFSAAELRLGERRQQVVRIVRDEASARRGS